MLGLWLTLLLWALWLCPRSWTMSATIANRVADYLCRGVTPTALTAPIKVSLHTADPGATGSSEVVGGSYARQAAGYAAASGGACALAGTVSFTLLPAVTVSHVGLWDSAGTPQWIQGAALPTPQIINAGGTFNLTAATNTVAGA